MWFLCYETSNIQCHPVLTSFFILTRSLRYLIQSIHPTLSDLESVMNSQLF